MGGDVDFKSYEQDQGQLFPSHLSEALDAGDSVFFIDDFVEGVELDTFEDRYAVVGERAYPPRMLLKLQNRQRRIDKLRAVRKQLELERGETLKSSSQKSFADPEANMMKTSEGALQYCYKRQVAANENGVIVANGVTASPLDVQQLVPMVEAIKDMTGASPTSSWPTRGI